jgi:L,D-transpeptidase ErfK/SrfK
VLRAKVGLTAGLVLAAVLMAGTAAKPPEDKPISWYGSVLCGDTVHYTCLTVAAEEREEEIETPRGPKKISQQVVLDWADRWPVEEERTLIMKVNRMNYSLREGYQVAVPKDLAGKTIMDFSPFPLQSKVGGNVLIIDLAQLAFAAYDRKGTLVRWGPAVGGAKYCADLHRGCRTPPGSYSVSQKFGPIFRSGRYPVGCRGDECALMPFAMFITDRIAVHGGELPGRHQSHGCIRVFYDDAEWLSKNFVKIGTRVVVRPYGNSL